MKKILRSQGGFSLIGVIIALLITSALGFAIVGASVSNHRITKMDSAYQSAYYIAESGINHVIDDISEYINENSKKYNSKEDFFNNFENSFALHSFTLATFEANDRQQPKAVITVDRVEMDTDTRTYKIASTGSVGRARKKVSSTISVAWDKRNYDDIVDNIMFYSRKLNFFGKSVDAPNGCVIMDGLETHELNGGSELNVSTMYFNAPVIMDSGSASFGSSVNPGNIYIRGGLQLWDGARDVYGDVRVDGNFRLKDAKIHGDVYVNGDVELGWTPVVHKNIYYTGTLKPPNNYDKSILNKCIKVDSVDDFEIPIVEFGLKDDSWYVDNGYMIKGHETGTIPHNAKMLVDSYYNKNWQNITGQVVIISKGDIVLRGGSGFTGALIAPNGTVEYTGDGTFNGIIIAKNIISLTQGGNYFEYMGLEELFGDEIPVTVDYSNEGGGGTSSGNSSVTVSVVSGIKEE